MIKTTFIFQIMSSVYEEFCSWDVGNLKDILSARGFQVKGINSNWCPEAMLPGKIKYSSYRESVMTNLKDKIIIGK